MLANIWNRFHMSALRHKFRGDIPLPESPRLTPLERAKRHRVQAQEARLKAAQCTGEEQAAFVRLAGNWERLAREADEEADPDPTVDL